MHRIFDFIKLPLKYHLVAGFFIRLLLIGYADFHDITYDVAYTDVDYKVFSDAARYVVKGESPYKRHTYRYSPIIAFMLVPNIFLGKNFGKLLFSAFDIFITIALKNLVQHQLGPKSVITNIPTYCSLLWLYNPLSIGISTRGNADSVPCFFILLSLLVLQTDVVQILHKIKLTWRLQKYVISGFLLGIAIHLRLYPLAFSFPMYLSLGTSKITRNTTMKEGLMLLWPNMKQLALALSCMTTLFTLTHLMYLLYGYEFLFETYIYHLFRKDTRHNFSILFYYSYLTMDQLAFDIVKFITQILEASILFVISMKFGTDPKHLPFAMFCQAVVLVTFNSVMTSQYFIWFLSLLPLVAHSFQIPRHKALVLAIIWTTAQGAWLFYAYLLEFKCREVFILIWLKSIVFFCSNIFILVRLVKSYNVSYGFGQMYYVNMKRK